MQPTDWKEVQETFDAVVTLSGDERKHFLENIATQKRELYNEVVSLLSADSLGEVLPNSSPRIDPRDTDYRSTKTNKMDKSETNSELSLAGELIENRYEIVRQLGSGGMGDVYLAHDKNVMNRETVIKLLKVETLANKEIVRKFKHEIEALARLKDPGIVTILDSGTHGAQPFLALEFIEGEDLSLIISPVMFSRRDFIDPDIFAARLSAQKTDVDSYFWKQLSPDARSVLSGQTTENKSSILRDEFNRLLSESSLYDPHIFGEREVAQKKGDENSWAGLEQLSKTNRLLIEETFPEFIVRGNNKKLSQKETAVIFRQLGQSLTHGHSNGIIHRDLKPANIMISKDGRGEPQTKLIDFGVAKVRESLAAPSTEIGLSFGTRKYMSPEQINSQPNLTAQSDIYALGLIAFETLTGQHIFRTDSFIEQVRMQEKEEFWEITKIRPDLSAEVQDVINKAVSFNPANRHKSASEFGEALENALLGASAETVASIETPAILPPTEIGTPVLPTKAPVPIPTNELATAVMDANDNFVAKEPLLDEAAESSSKTGIFAVAGIVLLLLVGVIGWFAWSSTSKPEESSAATTEKRELTYKLIVQKYQGGKPFQEPFMATGDEIFGDGWHFRMALKSPKKGNLYLLNENSKTQNLTVLFPHPQKNEGTSEIAASREVETGEMAFDENQGSEKFWIVWAEKPVAELEAVKAYVNPEDLGKIKDSEKEKAVRDFLTKMSDKKVDEKNSDDKQSKTISSTSDVLVKLAEFRHN